jgi:predicted P-loop ATPase
MWLISAVARVMKPGCKADHMLVLEARQGAGKSRALRVLAGDEYFCDSMPDLRMKDAQLQTFGAWIIEWAELDAMSRAETTAIKDFLTRQVEKLRRPYGHHTEDVPRQCVFAGTTNTRDYLRDETGNRRFWPVSCGRIDCDALARDREQLWAEAVALFDDGATWWPERADLIEALTKEQEARVSVDPWLERISRFIEALDDVKAERIMSECLELEVSRQGQAERNRVGRCLRLLNWEPSQWREGEVRVRGFRRIK